LRHTYRILAGTAGAVCIAAVSMGVVYANHDDDRPTQKQIAFAQEVSNLMLNEIVAALFTEFDETTPENVEHGKQAISLIFNDLNRDMRLIGAFRPLLGGNNDRPSDAFEVRALRSALEDGEAITAVQKVNDRWVYRRTVPLSNKMHTACVQCHANFTAEFFAETGNEDQNVGALVLSVPIRTR
jgi:hypothetical protein